MPPSCRLRPRKVYAPDTHRPFLSGLGSRNVYVRTIDHRSKITRWMDGFINSIEWIAAFFIGLVALDVFVSVLLRYFFGYHHPRFL